jgi:hypothetical protein
MNALLWNHEIEFESKFPYEKHTTSSAAPLGNAVKHF